MFESSTSIFESKLPCRDLISYQDESDRHKFAFGTCSIHEENYLYLVEFSEDLDSISCTNFYPCDEEIWKLCSSPFVENSFISCNRKKNSNFHFRVISVEEKFSLEGESGAGSILETGKIKYNAVFGDSKTPACSILWSGRKVNQMVTVCADQMCVWDITSEVSETVRLKNQFSHNDDSSQNSTNYGASLNTRDPLSFATATDRDIKVFDIRSGHETITIENAHRYACRDVAFNHKKEAILASCGEDRTLRFWDIRSTQKPLKSIVTNKNYWSTVVRYNPFYDQLLATGGTDSIVTMWRVASVSSAPTPFSFEDSESNEDVLVKSFGPSDGSVTSISWSQRDAWVMASLSRSGRVCIHPVPSSEKYRILL